LRLTGDRGHGRPPFHSAPCRALPALWWLQEGHGQQFQVDPPGRRRARAGTSGRVLAGDVGPTRATRRASVGRTGPGYTWARRSSTGWPRAGATAGDWPGDRSRWGRVQPRAGRALDAEQGAGRGERLGLPRAGWPVEPDDGQVWQQRPGSTCPAAGRAHGRGGAGRCEGRWMGPIPARFEPDPGPGRGKG